LVLDFLDQDWVFFIVFRVEEAVDVF